MTLQEFTNRGQDYADLREALREIATLKDINAALLAFAKEHLDAVCYCEDIFDSTPGNRCRVCRAHDLVNLVEGGGA